MNPTIDFVLAIAGLIAFALVFCLVIRSTRKRLALKPGSMLLTVTITLLLQPTQVQAVVNQYLQFIMHLPAWLGTIDQPHEGLVPLIYSQTLWYNGMLLLLMVLGVAWAIQQVRIWIDKPATEKPPHFESNALTILTVVVAIYLSVGALMAAPLAKQSQNPSTHNYKEELNTELAHLTAADSVIAQQFNQIITRNDSLITSLGVKGGFDLLSVENASLNYEVNNTFYEMLPSIQQLALARMKQTDDANLVQSLKLIDKRALLQWYKLNRTNMIDFVQHRVNAVTELLKDLNHVGIELGAPIKRQGGQDTVLADTAQLATVYDSIVAVAVQQGYDRTTALVLSTVQDSLLRNVTLKYGSYVIQLKRPSLSPVPERPDPGDHLGVFRQFMGWLFRVESYSAIIILGLVGFGLLGATAATFIREHTQPNEAEAPAKRGPLVQDLPSLLIRGISAALVVFLGMLGSVSLLSNEGNGASLPDANLLFFLALVAAVFSDTAWDWAKERFQKTLKEQDDSLAAEGKISNDQKPADS